MQVLDDASIRAAADDKMTSLSGQSDVEQSRNQAYTIAFAIIMNYACLKTLVSKYCEQGCQLVIQSVGRSVSQTVSRKFC